jgi:LuxR family maltose regulon positive regulatory protein
MQALNKGREKGQYEIVGRALFFLLRMCVATGNQTRAQEVLEELDRLLDIEDYLNRQTMYDIDAGWYFAATGQLDLVEEWLKSDFSVSGVNALASGPEDSVRAHCHLASKKYHLLLAFLDSRGEDYPARDFLFGMLELSVLRAICLFQLGDRDAAMQAFAEAYALASPNRLDMPFVECGNLMRSLAAAALNSGDTKIPQSWLKEIRGKAATYAKRVAHIKALERAARGNIDMDTLTAKELDMLSDLSQGLSRSEIASARGISVNTVKLSLRIIYDKLGAQSGMDAVRIAASRSLV